MATDGFDARQLAAMNAELLDIAQHKFPDETRKMLRDAGTQGRRIMKEEARPYRLTGNLYRSINRSAVKKADGQFTVRVYAKAPHAWLVEHGHRVVNRGGDTGKRAEGKHYAAKSYYRIADDYAQRVDEYIDDMLGKL